MELRKYIEMTVRKWNRTAEEHGQWNEISLVDWTDCWMSERVGNRLPLIISKEWLRKEFGGVTEETLDRWNFLISCYQTDVTFMPAGIRAD